MSPIYVIVEDVWIRTQKAAGASRHATNHMYPYRESLSVGSVESLYAVGGKFDFFFTLYDVCKI
jgi:hypothetical protein